MLRAYQLSSSANRGGSSESSSPWTLKDRTENQETNVRTRTVSTRILGLGIVLVGVLALAVGLIMGLEFPKYVYEKNKEAQCVLHVDHENYLAWQSGSHWKRKVKIYYWILTNKEGFLYRSEKPNFVEKGPYIYTETEEKYDVRFAVTEVSFRKHIEYAFDRTATELECRRCKEHEVLTIMNPWYLQRVFQKGGKNQLAWEAIPKYFTLTLVNQGLATSEDGTGTSQIVSFSQNISVVGNFNKATMITSSPLSDISFGTWYSGHTDAFPNVMNSHSNGALNNSLQFSDSEIQAIYNVFTNTTLLYGTVYNKEVKVDDSNEDNMHVQCEQWADSICTHHRRSHAHDTSSTNLLQCGVVYILHKCHENTYDSSEVSQYLSSVFCPSNDVCLNFSSMPDEVAFEFRRMLSSFLVHLTTHVYAHVLPSAFYDLVLSQNQSSLALGFSFESNDVVSSYFAKGFLYQDRNSASNSLWKVYTCLKDREMKNNMKMKEYSGYQYVPNGMFANQPTQSVSLASYTDFAKPCSCLQACVDCKSSGRDVSVFLEDLVRPVVFQHTGESSISDVTVEEYTMANSTFTNASNVPTATGLQDVIPFTGFMAWVGPPLVDAFHGYSSSSYGTESSFIKVEPVTGRLWYKNIKLQWNVGVSEEHTQAWGRSISPDFVSLPLPVTWMERVMTITDYQVDDYKGDIVRLMAASCGGLIAFSIIAIVVAIIGIIICIYPFKPNKVIPVFDEAVSSNVNGRH